MMPSISLNERLSDLEAAFQQHRGSSETDRINLNRAVDDLRARLTKAENAIGILTTETAVINAKVALAAAVGALIGGGIVSFALAALQFVIFKNP